MADINGFNPGDEIFSEEASLWCTVQDDGTYYVKNGDWYGTPLVDGGFTIHVPRYLDKTDGHTVVKDWALDEELMAQKRRREEGYKKLKESREKAEKEQAEIMQEYDIKPQHSHADPSDFSGWDDDVAF